jgi:hypothetical protein
MNTNTVSAIAFVLAFEASATAALARNGLTNEPDVAPAITADTAVLKDPAFNYGSRARVRLYRPDGVYDLRNGSYELSPSGFVDADAETLDD